MASKGKVLIILSGANTIHLKEGKDQKTGYFLSELGHPLMKILEAGYEVVFANPTGTHPVQDPISDLLIWFLGNYKEREREHALIDKMKIESNFASPRPFASLTDDDLSTFVGVFIPGGHAPMQDLHNDKELARILGHFHRMAKPTGAICHGPAALLSTKTEEGCPYAGYKVTAYSNTEDKLNEIMWWGTLPYKLVDELEKAGLSCQETFPMGSKVTVDRELVSGQNPSSASAFGDAFVKKLEESLALGGTGVHAKEI
ncbi:hypothetical protein SpCBS45565_g02092 [Spizellomyces sp. 'palustris']|nr:hypothetical protein SpCBS45565_g02092 [Spizellomyces sp. 'palustris']